MMNLDFESRPAIVVWEMTRACRLACRHCRAAARPFRDPAEFSTDEGKRLLDTIAHAEPQLLILTGGDPSRREDLLELIHHARQNGLQIAFSPSATPDLLALDFAALKQAGIARVSLSLDGATPETHNQFRGVNRAWDWTMQAIEKLKTANLPFQINSSISSVNMSEFAHITEYITCLSPAGWTLFLVVPTGRAEKERMPGADEVEIMLKDLLVYARNASFSVRTTEAMHYRRIVAQNADGGRQLPIPPPINDGKGFVFISHIGEVCPSGFLPEVVGNVREKAFLDIYRDAPVLRLLRDPDKLKGKCGRCEFRKLCGGSRARAYSATGDYLAEEPLCGYHP